MGQYANSSDNRTYYYTDLAIFLLAVARAIASTPCAYPWRDGQTELAWMARYNTKLVYPEQSQELSLLGVKVTSFLRLCVRCE